MQIYNSGFIGNFKTGDNIAHNLDLLAILYKYYNSTEDEEEKVLLRKPIIVTNVSVMEAIIYDFRFRAKSFTNEGISKIDKQTIAKISDGKKDVFDKLIAMVRVLNIFTQVPKFYDLLDELRQLRNRVHIQNEKKYKPLDEKDAFSEVRLEDSEFYLEYIIRYMTINHNRGKGRNHVRDFVLPWGAKLKDEYIMKLE